MNHSSADLHNCIERLRPSAGKITFAPIGTGKFNASCKDFFRLGEKHRRLGIFYVGWPADEWPEGKRRPIPEKTNLR